MAVSSAAKSGITTFAKYQKSSVGNSPAVATVVASGSNGGTAGVSTSTDGITWTFTAATYRPTTKFVYVKRDGIFWANRSSEIAKSYNGTTWISCGYPFSAYNTGDVDLKLTADPNDFTFTYQSVNATGNSIERLSPASGSIGITPQSTGISNSYWIVGSSSGSIYTRPKTSSLTSGWTSRTSGFSGQILDFECVGDTVVLGSQSGVMRKSTDGGATWASAGTAGSGYKQTVRYINGLWFSLTNGQISTENGFHTSSDLSSWTNITVSSQTDIKDICYANGLYIALFYSGRIYTSPDLTTWTQRVSNLDVGYAIGHNG